MRDELSEWSPRLAEQPVCDFERVETFAAEGLGPATQEAGDLNLARPQEREIEIPVLAGAAEQDDFRAAR